MRIRFLLGVSIAVAAMLGVADVRAQSLEPPPGGVFWYFGGTGGWTNLQDANTRFTNGAPAGIQRWRDGFSAGGRAGLEWGPWRFEEEFRYLENGNRYNITVGGATAPTTGNRAAYAIMTNVLYDFRLGWPITPHLGAGLGAVNLHETLRTAGAGTIVDNYDWELGYQGIAGIRYNLSPALAFDLDYRYLGTTSPRFRTQAGILGFPATNYSSSYNSHSVIASLSMRFGPPPPAPVVAAPAPPAMPPERKVFIVFFDWDKDQITPAGMEVVQQAAAAWKAGAAVQMQLQVTGYTDRSGSPGYNQRLSERRANNVAKALAGMGVPSSSMAVSGHGENDNRVPTADGAREPQNRRVEIVS